MRQKGGGGSHSVSFELMSPCWAGFDIQTMRQGSTQGGRLPLQYEPSFGEQLWLWA